MRLRDLYEAGGEAGWRISPIQHEALDRSFSTTNGGPRTCKRERKKIKHLAKSATRPNVITQDEIQYIESVIHITSIPSSKYAPSNPEEIDEIDRCLRYNAQVYNDQANYQSTKALNQFPAGNFDFSSELNRIFIELRIAELMGRNDRKKGLKGNELRIFDALVETFRNRVIEDLVLASKDQLEIRMRRAGYLRHTTKTSYIMLEDRCKEKNWKTGEKIINSTPSLGETFPTDVFDTDQWYVNYILSMAIGQRPFCSVFPYCLYIVPLSVSRETISSIRLFSGRVFAS